MTSMKVAEKSKDTRYLTRDLSILAVGFNVVYLAAVAAAMLSGRDGVGRWDSLLVLAIGGSSGLWLLARWLKIVKLGVAAQAPMAAIVRRMGSSAAVALTVPVVLAVGGRLAAMGWSAFWPGWALAGFGLMFVLPLLARPLWPEQLASEFIRGTKLLTIEEAARIARQLPDEGCPRLLWGGLALPDRASSGHFCVVGATDSGKTVHLRMLMQSVLPRIRRGTDRRAIIYDAKQDMFELLSGMDLSCPIMTLNPFDGRCAAWDLAKDVATTASALEVATIFIPHDEGPNSFFSKAGQELLGDVLIALHQLSPRRWSLRDVILTTSSRARMVAVLGAVPQSRLAVDKYLQANKRTTADVLQTISAHMAMFRPIAALWTHAQRRVSLEDWARGEFILLLGNEETLRSPLDAVNRVIFKRAAEIVLNQNETVTRQSWFFIDELKEAGKLDALSRLLTKGRSKGARVVLGFQDIEGLRNVYGSPGANELAAICANKAFLRTDSAETAEWAGRILGDMERLEKTRSETRGRESSVTTNENIVKREAVLASELLRLPPTDAGQLRGYFVTPAVGVYHGNIEFARSLSSRGATPAFVPRPSSQQHLMDWDSSDLERLNFPENLRRQIEELLGKNTEGTEDEFGALLQVPRITFDG